MRRFMQNITLPAMIKYRYSTFKLIATLAGNHHQHTYSHPNQLSLTQKHNNNKNRSHSLNVLIICISFLSSQWIGTFTFAFFHFIDFFSFFFVPFVRGWIFILMLAQLNIDCSVSFRFGFFPSFFLRFDFCCCCCAASFTMNKVRYGREGDFDLKSLRRSIYKPSCAFSTNIDECVRPTFNTMGSHFESVIK